MRKDDAMIDCKVGDWLVRNLGGIPLSVRVTALTDKLIICGGDEKEHVGWWFDRATGAEIDEDLGWGPPPAATGSFIDVGQPRHQVSDEKAMKQFDKAAAKMRAGGGEV